MNSRASHLMPVAGSGAIGTLPVAATASARTADAQRAEGACMFRPSLRRAARRDDHAPTTGAGRLRAAARTRYSAGAGVAQQLGLSSVHPDARRPITGAPLDALAATARGWMGVRVGLRAPAAVMCTAFIRWMVGPVAPALHAWPVR